MHLFGSLFSFCLSKSYWSCFTTPTTNDDHDDIDDIDDIDNGGRGRSLSYHAPHEQVVARHTALSSREYGKGELSGTCHDLISNTTLLLLYTTPTPHSITTLHHHTPTPHDFFSSSPSVPSTDLDVLEEERSVREQSYPATRNVAIELLALRKEFGASFTAVNGVHLAVDR